MERNEHKTKVATRRRRNLVAKDNKLRPKRHRSVKEYIRREKYPLDAL